MSNEDSDVQGNDEIQPGNGDVGYRVVLDLSDEDVDLIDRVAHEEGLQPTQILLQALRAYARHDVIHSVQVRAIGRLGNALRRAA